MNGSKKVGWARIQRKIEDWELYFSEPFTKAQAWIDLFTFANHKQSTFFIRGNQVIVERGEIAWSEAKIAERWQWSRERVRRFLAWLKTRQQIEIRKTASINKIFIVKYEEMQSDETTDETTGKPQKNRRRDTYKNDKNIKESSLKDEAMLNPSDSLNKKNEPTEPMNQDIDRSFPRKRLYGDESFNWLLDFFEHKFSREPVDIEKWSRIYIKHLKGKIGLGKVREILEWASDPDCWWYSRLTGFKMLYYKRETILKSMEIDKKEKVEKKKKAFIDGDRAYKDAQGNWMVITHTGEHKKFVGSLDSLRYE